MIKHTTAGDSVKLTFALSLEFHPEQVSVVGDFNGWDPLVHPLKKRSNGTRSVVVTVPADGIYRFKYLDDHGRWFLDPDVSEVEINEYGEANGVVTT